MHAIKPNKKIPPLRKEVVYHIAPLYATCNLCKWGCRVHEAKLINYIDQGYMM
jgi:hypothetical protein